VVVPTISFSLDDGVIITSSLPSTKIKKRKKDQQHFQFSPLVFGAVLINDEQ